MTVILFNCITLGMYEPCPPLDPDTGIFKIYNEIKFIVYQDSKFRRIKNCIFVSKIWMAAK